MYIPAARCESHIVNRHVCDLKHSGPSCTATATKDHVRTLKDNGLACPIEPEKLREPGHDLSATHDKLDS